MPSRFALLLALPLGACFAIPESLLAQQPQYPFTRLFSIFPAGGKAGTSVEVTITGADLEDASELYFSHAGIKAERVPDPDPKKAGQFLANKFKVTIAGDAPVGLHDVRAIGRYGVSNPRFFAVSDLNEVVEKEPNNDVPQAHKIDLNCVVNGQVNPNVDVDYFQFNGKKGQRVVVHCAGWSIDSRLDPFVQLFDGKGKLLAANRRYQDRDAVVDHVAAEDGEFFIRVVEHAHLAGGPEYPYRLTVTTGPWIDAAYPPVVEAGKPSRITLFGRNLPNGQPSKAMLERRPLDELVVEVNPPSEPATLQRLAYFGALATDAATLDGIEYRVRNEAGLSNPVLLTFVENPVILDNEDNDAPEKAQEITLPCEVCGRVEKRGDRDWYAFTAKANEVYVVEAFASRLGAPFDPYCELRRIDEKNPQNKATVADLDDNADVLQPIKFNTRSDDPKARVVIPADGKYELLVASREADVSAGPRHVYRISIRKEKPDFRLILVDASDSDPSAFVVRQGSNQYVHVLCQRIDGFAGEVTINVEGLPAGVTCQPQVLGPNLKQAALILTAAADAPLSVGEIKVSGAATINGQPVTREARGGCVVWPVQPGQNIPTLSRLTRSICLAVREKGPFALQAAAKELALPVGATVPVKVAINRLIPEVKVPVQVQAIDLPPNVTFNNNQPAPLPADKNEIDVPLAIRPNAPPGVYNLVIRGTAQFPFNKDPKAAQKAPVAITEAATPIKLTLFNSVGEIALESGAITVKPGTDVELTVKVNRLHGYGGEFKLQLVLPQGFQGVTAPEVTIPAGANEAKFVLKCPANAAPTANPNVVVRAVATIEKVNLNHDAKLNVTIAK